MISRTLPNFHLPGGKSFPEDYTPVRISWMVCGRKKKEGGCSLSLRTVGLSVEECPQVPVFGICSAPGKVLAKGRDGKAHLRNLKEDVAYMRKRDGIDVIVCLLNRYELRTIGIDSAKYEQYCKEVGIIFISYPIVEMAAPEETPQEFDRNIMEFIEKCIINQKKVICHCRGGIGRAGTIASCILLKSGLATTHEDAIKKVRSLRDKRCVESRKQEDFISLYSKYLRTGTSKSFDNLE